MSWIAIGCSHTSPTFSTPWPRYLAMHLGEPAQVMYSQGASNEFNLSKVIYAASLKPELIIWQWTEVSRLSLGIDGSVEFPPTTHNQDGTNFHQAQYTFNPIDNVGALMNQNKLDDGSADAVNWFMLNHVILSRWNLMIKPFQTLISAQAICKAQHVPLICFFWHPFGTKEVNPLISAIAGMIEWSDIVPEAVTGYFERKFGREWTRQFIVDDCHISSEGQQLIVTDILLPYLKERGYAR